MNKLKRKYTASSAIPRTPSPKKPRKYNRFLEPSSLVPTPVTSPCISRPTSPELEEVPSSQMDETELRSHDPLLLPCICHTLYPALKHNGNLDGNGVATVHDEQVDEDVAIFDSAETSAVGFMKDLFDQETPPSPVKAFQALFGFDKESYPPDFPESLR